MPEHRTRMSRTDTTPKLPRGRTSRPAAPPCRRTWFPRHGWAPGTRAGTRTWCSAATASRSESGPAGSPPGDPVAMRAAIEGLLDSPAEREQLAAAAFARAGEWTYAEYFAAVGELVSDSL